MSRFTRLSARQAGQGPEGPYEDVPDHLKGPLLDWVSNVLRNQGEYRSTLIHDVALAVEIPLPAGVQLPTRAGYIADACDASDEVFLDVVDAILGLSRPNVAVMPLSTMLCKAGSVWTVAHDGRSLEGRTTPTTDSLVALSKTPADLASEEITEAWSNIYGRSPDYSDAWDHAIKAVETLLAPIVTPTNLRSTLGTLITALEDKPSKWSFELSGKAGGVEVLTEICRLIWPNPDRHGGGSSRPPRPEEATAAVQVAVLLVQFCRDGALSSIADTRS